MKTDLELLFRHQTTADYFAYSFSGVTALFFVLAFLVLLLNIGSAFFLPRLKPIGLIVAYAALVAAVIYSRVTYGLGLRNIEGMKEAYILSRNARGLTVNEGLLSMMFSPAGFLAALFLPLLFYDLVAFLIKSRKNYFLQSA